MSSAGYITTPRCDEAASLRSRVNSDSSAQRIQRCSSGVLRDWTHPRRAQLASFPTVTGMASARALNGWVAHAGSPLPKNPPEPPLRKGGKGNEPVLLIFPPL